MRIDILTLFPEIALAPLSESIIQRARDAGLVELHAHNLRDWSTDKHKRTDDTPCGGGDEAPTGPSNLVAVDLIVGSGAAVATGDTVTVHYVGTLTNGTKFDSSYDRGQPFSFRVGAGQVIAGWDQGLVGMRVGGKRKLVIGSALAYQNQRTGSIPPNSTLVFDVTLDRIAGK